MSFTPLGLQLLHMGASRNIGAVVSAVVPAVIAVVAVILAVKVAGDIVTDTLWPW